MKRTVLVLLVLMVVIGVREVKMARAVSDEVLRPVAMDLWKMRGANIYNANLGKVGIGTSTPNQMLEVVGNILVSGKNSLIFGDESVGVRREGWGDMGDYLTLRGNSGFALVQTRNNSVVMKIDSSGNMAIGATAAGRRLVVAGNGSVTNGIHSVASFTQGYTNGVYAGYRADGVRVTSGLIYTDNQLPLILGSSSGEDYVKIERTKLVVGGGVKLNALGDGRPACTNDERGMMWFTKGVGASGPGIKDTMEVCAKDSGGRMEWRVVY